MRLDILLCKRNANPKTRISLDDFIDVFMDSSKFRMRLCSYI